MKGTAMRWYLGSMNDGLFIIDKPPRPSTDAIVYGNDNPNAPDLVLPVWPLSVERAQAIIDAHNSLLLENAGADPNQLEIPGVG
jgi:hypothetical protein